MSRLYGVMYSVEKTLFVGSDRFAITMPKLPQIESISHMKHRYNEVIAQLEHGPVALTQNSRAVAVSLTPKDCNAAVDEQEDLKDIIAGLRAELAYARGEDTSEVIDPATFLSEIVGENVSP